MTRATSPAGFTLDRAAHTVRFERMLAAPPAQVFSAWTQPDRVALWWDPSGQPLAQCDIDLRIGGGFTFVGHGHPAMPFTGTYREIVPGERLIFDALGAVGTVRLTAHAHGTHMTVEIICTSDAHFEQFVQMGVHAGTSATLDNLVRHADGFADLPA